LFVYHKELILAVPLHLVLLSFDFITGLLVIEKPEDGSTKIKTEVATYSWGGGVFALLKGYNLGHTFIRMIYQSRRG
jgi:hypothetical protein